MHEIIKASTSGTTILVPADPLGRSISVTYLYFSARGDVDATFVSVAKNNSEVEISGPLACVNPGDGHAPGYLDKIHFKTRPSEALGIRLSGSVQVGGWFQYELG